MWFHLLDFVTFLTSTRQAQLFINSMTVFISAGAGIDFVIIGG